MGIEMTVRVYGNSSWMPYMTVSDTLGLEWGPRVCISKVLFIYLFVFREREREREREQGEGQKETGEIESQAGLNLMTLRLLFGPKSRVGCSTD